jgi:hypothetical protein
MQSGFQDTKKKKRKSKDVLKNESDKLEIPINAFTIKAEKTS